MSLKNKKNEGMNEMRRVVSFLFFLKESREGR